MKTIDSLASFKGTLIRPEDAGYEESRRIWNDAIDKRPALMARCTDADDAAVALGYALGEGLPVAIRGGGHNTSGSALGEGGVVIDFFALRGVV